MSTDSVPSDSPPEETPDRRSAVLRGFLWNALIDGLGSYLVYILLYRHTSELKALGWSMLPPALNNLWTLIRKRHLDIVGVLVIGGLVAGVVLVLLGGSPRLLLVRDSFITGIIGLVFLASLLMPRPLLFYVIRQIAAGADRGQAAEWDQRYRESPSHLGLPRMTAVWGIVLVGEATLRTFLAITLPIPVFMGLWPFVNLGMYAATSGWSFCYGRRLQEREEEAQDGNH